MLVDRRILDGADATGIERALGETLADVLRVERVSADSHFFEDLGADSMVMARFCARIRKQPALPPVSIKDTYQHPTIRSLAAVLAPPGSTPAEPATAPVEPTEPASTRQYVLCGALQVLILLGYVFLVALAVRPGVDWISAGRGMLEHYLRTALGG